MAASNTEHYDAIVIGAGQAGGPLATALANAGRKTALIESTHVGGTCINEGCTPTKTMVASARVAYLARRAADYGVETGPVAIDQKRVRQAQARHRRHLPRRQRTAPGRDGRARLVDRRGRRSRGRNSSPSGVAGGEERTLTGELIFINTGARPVGARPPRTRRASPT